MNDIVSLPKRLLDRIEKASPDSGRSRQSFLFAKRYGRVDYLGGRKGALKGRRISVRAGDDHRSAAQISFRAAGSPWQRPKATVVGPCRADVLTIDAYLSAENPDGVGGRRAPRARRTPAAASFLRTSLWVLDARVSSHALPYNPLPADWGRSVSFAFCIRRDVCPELARHFLGQLPPPRLLRRHPSSGRRGEIFFLATPP
jgi:hypothetical protein